MSVPLDQILSGVKPQRAVQDVLQGWLPTYLRHLAPQLDMEPDAIATPKSWRAANEDFRKLPQDQTPALIVLATGLAEPPVKEGEGWYTAVWGVNVAAVVSASTEQATDDLAKLYAAAIRGAVLQHRSLDGVALSTDWIDEQYDTLPREDHLTLVGAEVVFNVQIEHVLNVNEGLDEVPDDIPDEWPDARTVDVEINKLPLPGEEETP